MNEPNPLPPIASPYGGGTPIQPPPLQPKEWANAPKIVKGWAYPLTWLGIIFLPLVIIMTFVTAKDPIEAVIAAILYGILFCVDIWLNINLKRGTRAAWTGQIVLSAFGLLGFPVGTLIHRYVLSQWFKPDVKAWFGQS
jgi:hypothetical protein